MESARALPASRVYAADMNKPAVTFVLVETFPRQHVSDPFVAMEDLRDRVQKITGIDTVELLPRGNSTAVATLPARNAREGDRLKDLLAEQLDGWQVVEPGQYSLPRTF
jgi:hypothetical protein